MSGSKLKQVRAGESKGLRSSPLTLPSLTGASHRVVARAGAGDSAAVMPGPYDSQLESGKYLLPNKKLLASVFETFVNFGFSGPVTLNFSGDSERAIDFSCRYDFENKKLWVESKLTGEMIEAKKGFPGVIERIEESCCDRVSAEVDITGDKEFSVWKSHRTETMKTLRALGAIFGPSIPGTESDLQSWEPPLIQAVQAQNKALIRILLDQKPGANINGRVEI